jgi:hypothetical protein
MSRENPLKIMLMPTNVPMAQILLKGQFRRSSPRGR